MVQVENVCLKIGKMQILKNINATFEKGKIHGLVGRNGSGKTMLLKCICGFVKTTEGRVLVNQKQVGKEIDFPDCTGIMIETPGFIPYYGGLKNLKILAQLNKNIQTEEIKKAMQLVGLDPELKRHVRKYSLGMRQRLGIAQAVMEKPELLILDEPFNGLDKDGVNEMRQFFLKLKEEGVTIIMASHNAEDINILCDTVHEMDKGILS